MAYSSENTGSGLKSKLLRQQIPPLGIPVDCNFRDCFIQNLPDRDSTIGVVDSFCESASYDGHKGTYIRVPSLVELEKGFDVLAVLDGKIKRVRNNVEDRIILKSSDRIKVKGRECGNGLVIDHGNGIETQYCHLKQGSIPFKVGKVVSKGEKIGQIGLSGLTEFPHLHLSIRLNNRLVDPNSGQFLDEACGHYQANFKPLWEFDINNLNPKALYIREAPYRHILKMGLTGQIPEHSKLVINGGPKNANTSNSKILGWVWFSNLLKGDQVELELRRSGKLIAKGRSEQLPKPKADYSFYVGKKRVPKKGRYELNVVVYDSNGKIAKTASDAFIVDN